MTTLTGAELGRLMHEAFNARDFAAVDRIFADDFHSHPLDAGRDAVRAAWQSMTTARPDARTEVEEVFGDGERFALRAEFFGLTDDDRPATLLEIFRVEQGRIAELWGAMRAG